MDHPQTPHQQSTPRARDWIAVDQYVTHLLSAAPDETTREAIRLAADTSAGPDPDLTGGGPDWQDALRQARRELAALSLRPLRAETTELGPDHPVRQAITAAIAYTDLDAADQNRLTAHLTRLFEAAVGEARIAERTAIADWLHTESTRLTDQNPQRETGVARALRDAAGLLAPESGG